MNWGSPQEFFHMGGYWFYVWGSYAVTLGVMVAEPLLARQRHRNALQQAARQTETDEDD